ncbi:MAG: isocitrate/isopropylmalate family dehydrogenase [Hymenobacter sp.]
MRPCTARPPTSPGQGKANPTALLRSALMMLEHLGEKEHAARIEPRSTRRCSIKEQCTGDLGGQSFAPQEFARFVIEKL